ncbi:hypothetical protein BH09GEM1_BH09GEM1_01840 [soil metagenome]
MSANKQTADRNNRGPVKRSGHETSAIEERVRDPAWSGAQSRALIGRALSILSAAVIAIATITPSGEMRIPGSLCLICGEVGGTDAVLNLLLYLPLGLGLAMSGVRPRRAISGMIAMTATIELLQWAVIPGRDGALGDVLTNSIGGGVGFLLGVHLQSILFPSVSTARRLAGTWLCLWVAIQTLASYAFHPSPTDAKYYGQLLRPLGDGELAYPGHVLRATLAGVLLPDWDLKDSHRAYLSLAAPEGAAIDVHLISDRPIAGRTPIARVLDERQQEEFMLMAEPGNLLFSVRTGAADLRLRPLTFRMPTPAPALPDTQHVYGRYGPPYAMMGEQSRAGSAQRRFRITPASAWRLITPVYTYADGSPLANVADTAWLFLLLAPAGYWLTWHMTARVMPRPGSLATIGVGAALVGLGFAAGPVWFHMAVPSWWEVLGATGGVAAGTLFARVLVDRHSPVPSPFPE